MAALATHYSSTSSTNRHGHRSSNINNNNTSNHGSTSSTAPLLLLLPCSHPHSALIPYHPSLASSSKLIRRTKSVCGLREWLGQVDIMCFPRGACRKE